MTSSLPNKPQIDLDRLPRSSFFLFATDESPPHTRGPSSKLKDPVHIKGHSDRLKSISADFFFIILTSQLPLIFRRGLSFQNLNDRAHFKCPRFKWLPRPTKRKEWLPLWGSFFGEVCQKKASCSNRLQSAECDSFQRF